MAIFSVIGASSDGTSRQYYFTIKPEDWVDEKVQINCEAITKHMNGDINIAHGCTQEQRYAARKALFYTSEQGEGYIVLGLDGDLPEVEIPIVLTIFPKGASEGTEILPNEILDEHINNYNNPHKITADQIGAASKEYVEEALSNVATGEHASTHAVGGSDPLTPTMIGIEHMLYVGNDEPVGAKVGDVWIDMDDDAGSSGGGAASGGVSEELVDEKIAAITPASIGAPTIAEMNAAISSATSSKQNKITGTAGQFVVIGDDGNVVTKTISIAEEASF